MMSPTTLRRAAAMHLKIAEQLEEMLIDAATGETYNPEEDILTREWDRQQSMAHEAKLLAAEWDKLRTSA